MDKYQDKLFVSKDLTKRVHQILHSLCYQSTDNSGMWWAKIPSGDTMLLQEHDIENLNICNDILDGKGRIYRSMLAISIDQIINIINKYFGIVSIDADVIQIEGCEELFERVDTLPNDLARIFIELNNQ